MHDRLIVLEIDRLGGNADRDVVHPLRAILFGSGRSPWRSVLLPLAIETVAVSV